MPPPPAAMFHAQPGRGASCVPNNERQLQQQNRDFRKARQAAASAPRLAPARVPARKAVEIPKAPSCLQIGGKRPRDEGGASGGASSSSSAATPVAKAATEVLPTAATAPVAAEPRKPEPVTSLVNYEDSDSEDEEPQGT